MPTLEYTKRFRKDLKKWKQSGQSMKPFEEFVRIAEQQWPLPSKYEAHLLLGEWEGVWDIHLRQNWILLVQFRTGTLRFLRMGTHADLKLS